MTAQKELRTAFITIIDAVAPAVAPFNYKGRRKLNELLDRIQSMPNWPNTDEPEQRTHERDNNPR